MAPERLRMVGGPMNGQVLWLDAEKGSVRVSVAATRGIPKRTYEYRRDGGGLVFVSEVDSVAPRANGTQRPGPSSDKGPTS